MFYPKYFLNTGQDMGCKVLSRVPLFVNRWTVARQAPLSWDFSAKNTGVGCHFLLRGIFLTQDRTYVSLSPALQANSLRAEPSGYSH